MNFVFMGRQKNTRSGRFYLKMKLKLKGKAAFDKTIYIKIELGMW